MESINSKKKESFIIRASMEALKSQMLFRHGCIAVYGGKPIASGYNHHRTYSKDKTILKEYSCSTHAEMDCIRKLNNSSYKNKLKDICLYVVKINNNNCKLGNSQPCSDCTSVLKLYKIKKVYHSIENGFVCKKLDDIIPRDSFGTTYIKKKMMNSSILV